MDIKSQIESGQTVLGIELGSTRIKAVLIDKNNKPIASGGHGWENNQVNGVWTYSLDDVWDGIAKAYAGLKSDVEQKFSVGIKSFKAIGFSGMMHGYMVFDKKILDYLTTDVKCDFEFGPLEKLAAEGEVMTFKHKGFWECADTVRDVNHLNKLWESGEAKWKLWK